MISTQWRTRLAYAAMSIFVTWHTAAMVLAPAPDNSVSAIALRSVFQPYLSLLKLDNPWDFFAPNVGAGSQLRYVVEDPEGNKHTFIPTEELSWFNPSYFWFRAWYYAIMDEPDAYAEPYALRACRRHAALRPVSVTLMQAQEGDFFAPDHLEGKHPMDSEFITVETIRQVRCPEQ